MSRAPLWLTAGFALGLGFGWLFFVTEEKPKVTVSTPQPPPDLRPAPTAKIRRDAGTLAEVEKVFQRWGGYAVWANDVTEIALWREQTKRRDDFYEVRRVGGKFYFRTLTRLSRPVIDHGVRSNLPIEFTETQAMYDAFHREHPDYDQTVEPLVELPPRPPEPYATPLLEQALPAVSSLTPGAGGGTRRSPRPPVGNR